MTAWLLRKLQQAVTTWQQRRRARRVAQAVDALLELARTTDPVESVALLVVYHNCDTPPHTYLRSWGVITDGESAPAARAADAVGSALEEAYSESD